MVYPHSRPFIILCKYNWLPSMAQPARKELLSVLELPICEYLAVVLRETIWSFNIIWGAKIGAHHFLIYRHKLKQFCCHPPASFLPSLWKYFLWWRGMTSYHTSGFKNWPVIKKLVDKNVGEGQDLHATLLLAISSAHIYSQLSYISSAPYPAHMSLASPHFTLSFHCRPRGRYSTYHINNLVPSVGNVMPIF